MYIANLIIPAIILACIVYQYQKTKLVNSFATLMTAIFAGIVGFAYFEPLANIFIKYGAKTRFPAVVPWTQSLSFALLVVLTFAILQTLVQQLTKKQVDFGQTAEGIGKVICGFFLGLVASGLLLTALVMAPLPPKYPYTRFDSAEPNPEKPKKPILNPDGFVTGLFSLVSRASLSGKNSFAAMHPDFLDQTFLNRLSGDKNVSLLTTSEAITLPSKKQEQQHPIAVWQAPAGLKGPQGKAIPQKSRHGLIFVRLGFNKGALNDAGTFTLSQVRVVCKGAVGAENALSGKGKNIYPVGYLAEQNQLQTKKLTETITVTPSDFEDKSRVKWLDFAFHIPDGYTPVLAEFKLNTILQLPPVVSADQAPEPEPFGK